MTGIVRKTYTRRTANIIDESSNKRRCIENISIAHSASQIESSALKPISIENSESDHQNDIRSFFLPVTSSSNSFNHKTVLPNISSSSFQNKRKKRRLRLNISEGRDFSVRDCENHHSSSRLIQQTIAGSGKELVNCKTCGMVYAFWEEKQHNLYHKKLDLEYLPIIKCKKAAIYEQKFEKSVLRIQVLNRNIEKALRTLGEKAIQFSSSNGLEMENIESNILWGLIPNPHDASDQVQVPHYKLYMMFYESQLIALLLAERIGYADQIHRNFLIEKKNNNPQIKIGAFKEDQYSNQNKFRQKVFMSIERLWVHQCYQRKGLATIIINEARKDFLHPFVLSKSDVAISWPTYDGDQFFRRYFCGIFEFSPYIINSADTKSLRSQKILPQNDLAK
ncbi:putative sister chromatid cohesion acetyltransferase eco1 [Erysiphe neolycopersici]|uniref:Putative sister chromatid cohesion acetyltransferase eco1 n=1 Tax=Erysiphe neolycopersici TaxID=212602 RepID=A0A420HXV0_9PEZI|nr:putative sister chromatid cohesion acetyltransferase eco1 [Erysiphe neolycopersici]